MTDESAALRENAEREKKAKRDDVYEIRFRGHLGDRWASRFPTFELTKEDDGTTLMVGSVVDQSALYGLINQVRDLGLELISVNRTCKED